MTITRQFFTVSMQFRLIDVTVSLPCTTFYFFSISIHQCDSLSLFSPSEKWKNTLRSICVHTTHAHTVSTYSLSTHNFSWPIIYFPRTAIVLTTTTTTTRTHTHSISTLNESMNEWTISSRAPHTQTHTLYQKWHKIIIEKNGKNVS